ncbi:MAG: hypothetical protein NTW32_21315 [Chloroflexi bacterium]|nr:hypothetical protein [Chloroflexota bacterium]
MYAPVTKEKPIWFGAQIILAVLMVGKIKSKENTRKLCVKYFAPRWLAEIWTEKEDPAPY